MKTNIISNGNIPRTEYVFLTKESNISPVLSTYTLFIVKTFLKITFSKMREISRRMNIENNSMILFFDTLKKNNIYRFFINFVIVKCITEI